MRVYVQGEVVAAPLALSNGQFYGLTLDTTGALRVTGTGGGGSVVVEGNVTPSDAFANPTDAVPAFALLGGFDSTAGTWGRVDRFVPVGTGIGALVVAGIGSGLYRYAEGPNSSITIPLGGDIPFEVQTFPLIRVRNTQDFAPPRAGYSADLDGDAIDATPNVIPVAAYNETPPAGTDLGAIANQADQRGNLLMQVGRPASGDRDTPDVFTSSGVASVSIKASAGNLLSITAGIGAKGELPFWLCIVSKGSAPANGDVAVWSEPLFPITGDEAASSFYQTARLGRDILSQQGIRLGAGVAACLSSTPGTVALIANDPNISINATFV